MAAKESAPQTQKQWKELSDRLLAEGRWGEAAAATRSLAGFVKEYAIPSLQRVLDPNYAEMAI